jgi:hypothetical protein
MGFNEALVSSQRIFTDAQDDNPVLVKFRLQITEASCLFRSARGVILGVEKNQQPFTAVILKAVSLAIATFKVEFRSCFVHQCHSVTPDKN